MTLVAGIDSSTQSVKIVVRDAETGVLVREARAPHPDGTEVHPRHWVEALDAVTSGVLEDVEALSIAGQQHGMVALDEAGEVVRPALLWNDTRSAPDALDLIEEFGGPEAWADAVGSVPVAAFTVTKARWMARVEPENAARTARMMLPHDYLTWTLAGRPDIAATDRGEVSGTGYWSPATGEYRDDLLRLALGSVPAVPRVAAPGEEIGRTASGIALGPGTGDNMGAALGLGAVPGDVVVSLGTSGTAFAVSTTPARDASGFVAGFADATGHFLPLVCTLNAARVLTAMSELLGVDFDEFAGLALSAEPGSGGLTLLPYLDGERTPNLPDARGSMHGITRANLTRPNLARAAIEGMFGGLADAVDALVGVGVQPKRILLVGGAAANPAVGAVAATMFTAPIVVPPPGEYVADGAARQAAWVLAGGADAPAWPAARVGETLTYEPVPVPAVREAYGRARVALHGG
jgi:xylulokinase